ncbi:MAG TPA: hypothetical protein VEW07_13330 [Solirubrobacterales bacterium]|nr:hypothetical protein [Solirubrobacterales bacterium]
MPENIDGELYMTDAERKAVERVQRAIKALPKSIAIYFNGDTASVIACNEDGFMRRDGEGFDRDAICGAIWTPRCEAGAW